MADPTPTPEPTPAPTPTPTPTPAWFDGFDDDLKGYVVNRGLDKGDPVAAFQNAAAAHRNAEKAIGIPADKILRLPKDASDEAGWNEVYAKLGRPTADTGYEFKAEGDEDKAFVEFLRKEAFAAGLTKSQAERIYTKLSEYGEKVSGGEATLAQENLAKEDKTLRDNWGTNYALNLIVAQRGARSMGVSDADFEAAKAKPGFATAYEFFRKHGQAIGEDKFISGNAQPNGVYTREQAVAKRSELLRDAEWTRRYRSGDQQAMRDMRDLSKIIAGDERAAA